MPILGSVGAALPASLLWPTRGGAGPLRSEEGQATAGGPAESRARAGAADPEEQRGEARAAGAREHRDARAARPGAPRGADGRPLSREEEEQLRELQARDRAVRAHEAAHKAVGGALAGSMSFSYQTGPDGRQYAVGGEVTIDVAPERDPRATVAKMRQVIAAALAPADPSPQDRAVAAQAAAQLAEAQRQLATEQREGGARDGRRTEREPPPAPAGRAAARLVGAYGPAAPAAGGLLSLIA